MPCHSTTTAPRTLGRCTGCNQPIFENERLRLQAGRAYCAHCRGPLRTPPPSPNAGFHADPLPAGAWFCTGLMTAFFAFAALLCLCTR